MIRKRFLIVLSLVLGIMLLVACSDSPNEGNANNPDNDNDNNTEVNNNDDNENNDSEEPAEDITLRFWYPGDPEAVEERLGEVFPHITFEFHDIQVVNAYKETMEEEFTKGQIPDIMVLTDYSLSLLKNYEMLYDLTPYIDSSSNLDIDSWPEYRVKAMHAHKPDDNGIYSLPANLSYHALAYNKAVFDKFGAPYPTDDMTWDEVIDLARLVTGERDGEQYRGLDIALDTQFVGMLDDWIIDANDEVHFEGREDIREMYGIIDTIASIPGNLPDREGTNFFTAWDYEIYNRGNVAMSLHKRFIAPGFEDAVEEGLIGADDFDFVSWPILDTNNPTQPYTDGVFYSLSPESEHPDEAFKVIEYLVSDEWLDEHDPLDYNSELLKTKNMEAFTRHPLHVPESRASEHQVTGRWLFGVYANKMIYEGLDINTAIRQAQEEAEGLVKEATGSD